MAELSSVPMLCILYIGTVQMLCILDVGTVPTLCILNVGTVPTLCILNIGTVPTFSPSLFLYLNGFNAKIGFEKYGPGPEILIRMCQNLGRQTKPAYFEMFLPIFQNLVHVFKTDFCVETRNLSRSF